MFNARKIKQLEEDKEKLRRQIETLDAINDGQKIIINNLKKRLEEYEELFELKDQTVVIQQEGKYSQLLIGGKLIRKVTSVEMNKQAMLHSPKCFYKIRSSDKLRRGKRATSHHGRTKHRRT